MEAALRQHLTQVKTTISTKGQIVLPAPFRAKDKIRPGDSFQIERVKAGEYLVRKAEEAPNKGLVDWLLSCPVNGYFEPIVSESTDTL